MFIKHFCFDFQGRLAWDNGGPVAFQQFLNTNYMRKLVTYYCFCYDDKINKINKCDLYSSYCPNIDQIKSSASSIIHPLVKGTEQCTMMLFSNLAEPDWIFISCNEPYLYIVVCSKNKQLQAKQKQYYNTMSLDSDFKCYKFSIMVTNKCFTLNWKNLSHVQHLPYLQNSSTNNIYQEFHHIFDFMLMENMVLFVLLEIGSNTLKALKIYRYLDVVVYKNTFLSKAVEGIYLSRSKMLRLSVKNILFHCTNGGFVLIDYICDLSVDCPNDKSDEENCTCWNVLMRNRCKKITTKIRKKCSFLYYSSHSGECLKYNNMSKFSNSYWNLYALGPCKEHVCGRCRRKAKMVEEIYNKNTVVVNRSLDTNAYECVKGQMLDFTLINDLIPDCGPDAEDEPKLNSLLRNNIYHSCPKPDMIPCKEGHSHCFTIMDICAYKLSKFNNIFPCRNGKYLQNCIKFQCNTMFKCFMSYCVLWTYVCDGKWDCPEGDDEEFSEICGNKFICNKMYKCKETRKMCVHLGNVCDGYEHCPYGDDEMFCNLQNVYCPFGCHCLLYAIECKIMAEQNSMFHNLNASAYFSIHISSVCLLSAKIIDSFTSAFHVEINGNDIKDICTITNLKLCITFDAGNKLIRSIRNKCFTHFGLLNILILKENLIASIKKHSFFNLCHLKFLDISNNPIRIFSNFILKNINNFKVLNILNLTLKSLDTLIFDDARMKIIVTNDYHVCCIAPEKIFCSAHESWYRSCSDILPNSAMKYLYGIVCYSIIILNIGSMCIVTKTETNKLFSVIVKSINMNAIVCGSYILCIWVVDLSLKGIYPVKEEWWRSSVLCNFCCAVVLYSTLLAPLLILFFSISRLMVVVHPIDTKFKQWDFVVKQLASLIICSFLVALFFSILHRFTEVSHTNNLCLPFTDPTRESIIVKIITWCVDFIQIITAVLIVFIHILLGKKIKQSQSSQEMRKSVVDPVEGNYLLILQLILITVSNILCWLSTNSVYIAAMFLDTYPTNLITWTIVTCLPLNSIIMPLVFITLSVKKLLQKRRKRKQTVQEKQENQKSAIN